MSRIVKDYARVITKPQMLALPPDQRPRRFLAGASWAMTVAVFKSDMPEWIMRVTLWSADTVRDGKEPLAFLFFGSPKRDQEFTQYIDLRPAGWDLTYTPSTGSWHECDIDYYMSRYHCDFNYRFAEPGKTCCAKADEKAAQDFLQQPHVGLVAAIRTQQRINRSRRHERKKLKERQYIDHIIDQRKPLPADLDRFINNRIFRDERYIIYRREGKNIAGRCTHCLQDVTFPAKRGMKYLSPVACPSCHTRAKLIAPKKYKSGEITHRSAAIVVNRIDEGILFRCIHVWRKYDLSTGLHKDETYEDAIVLKEFNGANKEFEERCVNTYSNQNACRRWEYERPVSMMHSPAFRCGHLYTANLRRELRDTPWHRSALEILGAKIGPTNGLWLSSWLDEWKRQPHIERLVKAGLIELAVAKRYERDFIKPKKKLHQMLGVIPSDLPTLKRLDITPDELKFYALMRERSDPNPAKWIRWMRKHKISGNTMFNLASIMTHANFQRLIFRYFDEQVKRLRDAASHERNAPFSIDAAHFLISYRDYLGQCRELTLNLDDTSNRWPSDLYDRHNKLSARIKHNKKVVVDKAIRAQYKADRKKFEWAADGYVVLLPKNQADIINEGKRLGHCVGSYTEKVARGETRILFIRSAGDRSKPLATAEFQNGKITQFYIEHDHQPPKELQDFMDKYIKKVLNSMIADEKKEQLAAPAV